MTVPAPPVDVAQLVDFPTRDLDAVFPFARIHRADRDPEWFCNREDCRFDPPAGFAAVFGTCYLSTHPAGAYIEKFGRFERLIPQSLVDDHRLSVLLLASPLRVADLTNRTILGRWSLTAEIWGGDDYEGSRRWAQALFEAGFGGICYRARHDVQGNLTSIAVFGKPEYQPGQLIQHTPPGRIPPDLIESAAVEFGIEVIPGVL